MASLISRGGQGSGDEDVQSVSIVVAAWNAAAFIDRALRSALSQTGVDFEVIVVDDASADDTAAVVEAYGDPRIRCHRAAQNGGPAAARNIGFGLARNDWIAVLDADDTMSPERLGQLIQAAEAANADIVADNFWIQAEGQADRLFIDEPLDGAGETVDLADFLTANRLFRSPTPLGYLKPVFRRSFLAAHGLRYDTDLRIGEDCQLIIEALLAGARYLRHHSAGYAYLTREGSISHRLTSNQARAMAAAERRILEPRWADLTAAEQSAGHLQLASLETGAAFIETVERLKRRDLFGAAANVARRPQLLPHFAMPLRARLGALMPGRAGASFRS